MLDIEASARKHGVSDADMLHAVRHHWRAFETDDSDVTMFIEPSATSAPLEIGVADRREGVDAAIIEAVRYARAAHRSWSEIGAMLGVSKQVAQTQVLQTRRLTRTLHSTHNARSRITGHRPERHDYPIERERYRVVAACARGADGPRFMPVMG